MRKLAFAFLLIAAAACSDATSAGVGVRPGTWGSANASLVTTNTGATISIDASGCFGSYGEVKQRLPAGTFSLDGTFTVLMGVYPGRIDYPAQFTGTTVGNVLSMTIVVPAIQQTLGPYAVTYGVLSARMFCLYP